MKRNIIIIIFVILLFQIIYIPKVNAEGWTDIFYEADKFLEDGKQGDGEKVLNEEELKKFNSNVYNLVFSLGVVLSVIVGGVLGIQIMWGSVEQQAKAKEALMPYVIGCFIMFSSFGIWKIVVNIGEQLDNNNLEQNNTETDIVQNGEYTFYCPECGAPKKMKESTYIKNGGKLKCLSCTFYGTGWTTEQ